MERRFKQQPTFQKSYRDFRLKYEHLGHMTKASSTSGNKKEPTCFLTHHGVIKESSTTTKLQVVFNGSQQGMRGASLNNHLFTGPNLLPALIDVLLRWRTHRYALVADIEKMCRQLNTVTYGLACALYLAIRTLRQQANDKGISHPLAASALLHDIYVDDILTGAPTLSETKESLWLRELEWDTPLASSDTQCWRAFEEELHLLDQVRVPRWLYMTSAKDTVEIHGFADASERAYAAVVYLRVNKPTDSPSVSLVVAKAKVVPLKQVSLPRLELCASALLVKLTAYTQAVLQHHNARVHFWTDSIVALEWIQGHPSRWRT
ncbi:pao retrotransposon peptidase superfamily, partial [Lasius niger]